MSHALQCPRCNGSVTVSDQAAGQRVKCPHCEQSFLAPGAAAAKASDDDDWLVLDSDPVLTDGLPDSPPAVVVQDAPPEPDLPVKPAPAIKSASSASPGKGPSAPSFDDDLAEEIDDLGDGLDDLDIGANPLQDDPVDEVETLDDDSSFGDDEDHDDLFDDLPPMAAPTAAPSSSFGGIDLPPMDDVPPPSRSTKGASGSGKAPTAQPVEYESEYRVKCNVCGSVLYARAEQAGKSIKCSDCHSPVPVPPPPRKKVKNEINLEEAETFSLEQTEVKERRDPFQKSADELLENASRVEEESETTVYDDVPSIKEWAKNVFGIFLDPGVLVHWLALSAFAAIPAFLALSMESKILVMGLFPGGFFFVAIVVGCGFAILLSVANEEKTVSEWPVFDPVGWFSQLFVAIAAAGVAAVPAWAIAQFIFGPSLIAIALTMLSVYTLFPFVVLSMLDMQSALMPFSAEVARSVTKCEEAWGGFYFSSGLLFVGLFLILAIASMMEAAAGSILGIFASVAVTFIYFSMIGRLAYAIGQSVNAPPMKNDIDRQRHPRSRDGSVD